MIEAIFPFPRRGKAWVQFFKELALKLIVFGSILPSQNTVTNGEQLAPSSS
jgi:hypothetical protein